MSAAVSVEFVTVNGRRIDPRELRPHPAAELYPAMSVERFEELKKDIRERGIKTQIVLCDGMVLDGRHRLRACIEMGVTPRFIDWTPSKGETPYEHAWSLNELRREALQATQRAAILYASQRASDEWRERVAAKRSDGNATKGKPVPRENATGAGRIVSGPKGGIEVRELAKAAKVGETVAQTVVSAAKRNPGLFDRMVRGEVGQRVAEKTLSAQIRATTEPMPSNDDTVSDLDPTVTVTLGAYKSKAEAFLKSLRALARDAKELRRAAPTMSEATAIAKLSNLVAVMDEAVAFAEAATPVGPCAKCGGRKPFCTGSKQRCGGWKSAAEKGDSK